VCFYVKNYYYYYYLLLLLLLLIVNIATCRIEIYTVPHDVRQIATRLRVIGLFQAKRSPLAGQILLTGEQFAWRHDLDLKLRH